jgi:3-deoxy-D-manno-octulosonate 8-phosphate phosphatase (KDO 8-P phosphatase)
MPGFDERCRKVRLLLTDVDGVLTDGRLFLLPGGGEAKAFHVRDGLAFVLARQAGLLTGLLSGRSSAEVARRAAELRLDVVRQGIVDKLGCLRQILDERGLSPLEVAYMGDDLNDLALMREVGLPAAPADAVPEVRGAACLVAERRGGEGCLRELVEAVLRARGEWDLALRALGAGPAGS